MEHAGKLVYAFGPFRVDPAERLLLRDNEVIPLRPKAFDALLVLCQNSQHLVSKDQLMARLWPGTFVDENNLSQNMSFVRKALGSKPDGSAYVETVAGHGYRFASAVSIRSNGAMAAEPSGQAPPASDPIPARSGSTRPDIVPETRYARSGDLNIAYQVVGDGPIDLVYVPGWVTHIEYAWEDPALAAYYQRLASFSRLILFDKRGTGLSDRTADIPTLEQRMDDVRAVMDAVGSERAALFGASEGGNMCVLFAATYPERTLALITYGIFAKRVWDPEYPWAPTPEARDKWYRSVEHEWGGVVDLPSLAPSAADDPGFARWWSTYLRRSTSPRAALTLARANTEIDVRSILPAIRVPTLVLQRAGDLEVKAEEGRYIAARIPGARYVELPGVDHLPWVGDQKAALDEVEEFVTGVRHTPEPDRLLATVVVARIVRTAGDHSDAERWRRILTRYQTHAGREIEWFKGRTEHADDERMVATFDGPARAIKCARAISEIGGRAGIGVAVGLHTGECDFVGERLTGRALEIASHVAGLAGPGEVLVSYTVKALVAGSGIRFGHRHARVLDEDAGGRLFTVER
jgi:DNA-binding winged helix-turn-helix (wHTH) protein/pimeloyl-ACP methyl ester carboxylesterase/class 3 adenylate cyclase